MDYSKLPPQANELESALMGAALIDSSKLQDLFDIIPSGECFYVEALGKIYTTLQKMFANGNRIDFMTVCEHLRKQGELDAVGGSYFVTSLTRDVISAAHIEEHARIVMEKFLARELIKHSSEAIKLAYDPTSDIFSILDQNMGKVENLLTQQVKREFRHVSVGSTMVLAKVVELMNSDVKLIGIPSGYHELDNITGGWEDTNLIILAARPAVGKTAFALNLAVNAVKGTNNSKGVGIFSLEMSESQLLQRMMANIAQVELSKIKNGTCDALEFRRLEEANKEIDSMPIYIDDTGGLKLRELRIKAKKMKRKHGVGMIIIDYLQLMHSEDKTRSREEEVSKITSGLKLLAKELELPIIALCQLNRSVESRTDPEPQLSDLRESGSIEQEADSVIFLYRPKDSTGGMSCISLGKNRHGRTAKFAAYMDGRYQKFNALIELDSETGLEKIVESNDSLSNNASKINRMQNSMPPKILPPSNLPF